jgi:hypothetical protein
MRRRRHVSGHAAAAVRDAPPDHVTPYDRFAWSDTQIEQWLARGEHAAELCAYFGNAEHRQLSALARRAARLPAGALRVILVPGIMGSQLGLLRPAPLPNDVLWIDPIDIQHGRLAALRLPGTAPVVSLGVVLFSYLRLKLQLRARGFAVEFHDYDWRRPVQQLGAELAARLRAARGRVALVAHSMGGLVARMALGQPGTAHVERVVLLGTPNLGSFAAVQALRGTYAVVRKVARLVARGSPEELTREVFSSFPSLYDLLPAGAHPDLFDPAHWPRTGLRPRAPLLAAARAARHHYVPADERFVVIAGTGQETVTAVTRSGEQFIYTITRHGDGTVPTRSAMLPGARCVYTRVAHSELTRDPVVAAAVVDLLNKGRTARLPARWRNASRARVRIGDGQLSGSDTSKVEWAALSSEQRRLFLENLNEPPHLKLRVPVSRTRKPRRARVRRI